MVHIITTLESSEVPPLSQSQQSLDFLIRNSFSYVTTNTESCQVSGLNTFGMILIVNHPTNYTQ